MINKIKLLVIEDEEFDIKRIKRTIEAFEEKIKVIDVVNNGEEAIRLVSEKKGLYDVVIMDFQISGRIRGEVLIKKLKSISPTIQIIVVTKMTIHISDFGFAKSLLDAGALWYCTKYPADIEDYIYQPTDFILNIFNAYEKKQLELKNIKTKKKFIQKINDILVEKEIIGSSEYIKNIKKQIEIYSQNNSTVLITGESGTGKELVAFNIHYRSGRKFEKFLSINCASLPETLLESELFGYEKGSFTGATESKKGIFESANNGTVFLDEIGELSLPAQAKLLRVLEYNEIDKIGKREKIKINVRVICATNKNLEEEVKKGKFRKDLFYRINVLFIKLKPLRERKEDIPELFDFFLKKYANEFGIESPTISDSVYKLLLEYDWPGNIRQLQNVVQRLLLNYRGNVIKEDNLLVALGDNRLTYDNIFTFDNQDREIKPLKYVEKEFRKKYFLFVRKNTKSDAEAARLLGLAPPNYYRMCKELGIK